MSRALEVDFPPEKQVENLYDLETTGEIFRNLFNDDSSGISKEYLALLTCQRRKDMVFICIFRGWRNWNELTRKFREKFFLISKIQHLRRQVINFMQGEEEGIDQPWIKFYELIEQGPRLGYSGDILLHTFFFFLTPSCMEHVQMCAGGDLIKKTLTKDAQLLQKISKAAAMRRVSETRHLGRP
jgi:hypothetical protein